MSSAFSAKACRFAAITQLCGIMTVAAEPDHINEGEDIRDVHLRRADKGSGQ
jgi:hypothetical protein